MDNDSIPELVLDFWDLADNNDYTPVRGNGDHIFTYKNGEVLHIGDGDRFQYYPKKGVFVEVDSRKGYKNKLYVKLSKGRASNLLLSCICLLDEDERKAYGYVSESYWDGKNLEIAKSTFNKRRKKYVGSTKRKDVDEKKFHQNTKKNRKKYLS